MPCCSITAGQHLLEIGAARIVAAIAEGANGGVVGAVGDRGRHRELTVDGKPAQLAAHERRERVAEMHRGAGRLSWTARSWRCFSVIPDRPRRSESSSSVLSATSSRARSSSSSAESSSSPASARPSCLVGSSASSVSSFGWLLVGAHRASASRVRGVGVASNGDRGSRRRPQPDRPGAETARTARDLR